MFKILFSSFIAASGIMIIYLGFTDVPKRVMEISTRDIVSLKKYLKFKKLLDLSTGLCLISIGILSIKILLPTLIVGLLCSIVFILNRIVEYLLNRNTDRKTDNN